MCTVTYIPSKKGYRLTSNRDEKHCRKTALHPLEYEVNHSKKLIFPKDADAGGTWIALKENGDALCILNGAFENFSPDKKYIKSRGIVLVSIASYDHMIDAFISIGLNQTAPFTLIIVNNAKLYACRWDGRQKYINALDASLPHIWSSATLYNKTIQLQRKKWFNEWLSQYPSPTLKNIIDFHKNTGSGDKENDLVMNRNNQHLTVSITVISVDDGNGFMEYQDLIKNDNSTISFVCEERFN